VGFNEEEEQGRCLDSTLGPLGTAHSKAIESWMKAIEEKKVMFTRWREDRQSRIDLNTRTYPVRYSLGKNDV
jgi:hypothetical protein